MYEFHRTFSCKVAELLIITWYLKYYLNACNMINYKPIFFWQHTHLLLNKAKYRKNGNSCISLNTYKEEVAQRKNPGQIVFHPLLHNKAFISALRNLKDMERSNTAKGTVKHNTSENIELVTASQNISKRWRGWTDSCIFTERL